ncbi:uncharacterized protein EV154DRAFT_488864 [Mucor mucedo]|uniref:uncharacterized protein n=1 Tax=Mucor mucedo TaxID=29922 RepID=UPI00221F51A1|nr:uncharacterized protein EV154DRAFT_488864 [Mucor mucedo]KAI7864638.1 hypothetical protein EV154DRAFT_488864 [Mucor mucedo]
MKTKFFLNQLLHIRIAICRNYTSQSAFCIPHSQNRREEKQKKHISNKRDSTYDYFTIIIGTLGYRFEKTGSIILIRLFCCYYILHFIVFFTCLNSIIWKTMNVSTVAPVSKALNVG